MLETVERADGFRDPQLDVTPIPEGFDPWFERFMLLRTRERVSYSDMDAYERVTGVKLGAMEVMAILAMDRAAVMAMAEVMKE